MIWDEMQRIEINGVELEIYDSGSGEPVVFIHGGMSDECAAVLKEPALADSFRLIHYHLRGWGNSEGSGSPVGPEQHAADCRAVMQHLGVEQAHVVGQSGGGAVALQLVRDFPDAVHSLALLEPALYSVIGSSPAFEEAISKAASLYETGDKSAAMETFGRTVCGDDYRAAFDQTLPEGYFDRWVADADALFDDMAKYQSWNFTREDAAHISQPVLNMTGAHTTPAIREVYEAIRSWLPHAENVVLPDTTHCILQMNPDGAAERLADFFKRHSIRD